MIHIFVPVRCHKDKSTVGEELLQGKRNSFMPEDHDQNLSSESVLAVILGGGWGGIRGCQFCNSAAYSLIQRIQMPLPVPPLGVVFG